MLFKNDLTDLCVLYALTPVHAGSGQALGTVDLPIQRERHTNWPQVQSSGMKGAFRDWFTRYFEEKGLASGNGAARSEAEELAKRVFGCEEGGEGSDGQAGAVAVTDARLLGFPVRSSAAPFVWTTCPALLARLIKDLALTGTVVDLAACPSPGADECFAVNFSPAAKPLVLEDMALTVAQAPAGLAAIKDTYNRLAPGADRLVLVSDQAFSFLVETATEVQPQIKIDADTGTTTDGSLRYQELLPADSILYSLVFFGRERTAKNPGAAAQMRSWVQEAISSHVQIGGDMTLGRGIMAVRWANGKA
ncbi:MAG: type III-B CRISPR module RAMP protein Cmr4 [Candidatus Latescibacterota bacterium]